MRNKVCLMALGLLIFLSITVSAQSIVYSSNVNAGKQIALTFDDGPHPRITPQILEILDEYGIKATFFVIGVNSKNYPNQLKQIVDGGHEIGNHTYSHKILKSMSKEEIEKEILDTETQVEKITNITPNLLRPPCGIYDETLIEIAQEKDLKVVLWTVDSHDWSHRTVANIVQNVTKNASNGDILLFHDYVSGEYNTPNALRKIIPLLIKQGYEFVTVSELLQSAS